MFRVALICASLVFDECTRFPTQVNRKVTPAVSRSIRLSTWEPLAVPHTAFGKRMPLAALQKSQHICWQGVTARREGALLETLESMQRCGTSLAARAENDSDDVIDLLQTSCQRDPVTRNRQVCYGDFVP